MELKLNIENKKLKLATRIPLTNKAILRPEFAKCK